MNKELPGWITKPKEERKTEIQYKLEKCIRETMTIYSENKKEIKRLCKIIQDTGIEFTLDESVDLIRQLLDADIGYPLRASFLKYVRRPTQEERQKVENFVKENRFDYLTSSKNREAYTKQWTHHIPTEERIHFLLFQPLDEKLLKEARKKVA